MRNILTVYYSPTGGCKKISLAISNPSWSVNYLDITFDQSKLLTYNLSNIDVIFIVAPVYAQNVQRDVLSVIKKIKFNEKQFSGFLVPCVCYGAVSPGRALKVLSNALQKSGGKVIGGGQFVSKHSYATNNLTLGLNRPNIDDFVKLNTLCENVEKFICKKSLANKAAFPNKFNPLSLILPNKMAKIAVKLPEVIKEKCSGCKKCQQVCPNNIIDSAGQIIQPKKCTRCLACYNNCPNFARKMKLNFFTKEYLEMSLKKNLQSEIFFCH